MLGANEFLPSTKFIQVLGQILCNDESSLNGICNNILFLIAGYDKAQLNQVRSLFELSIFCAFEKSCPVIMQC